MALQINQLNERVRDQITVFNQNLNTERFLRRIFLIAASLGNRIFPEIKQAFREKLIEVFSSPEKRERLREDHVLRRICKMTQTNPVLREKVLSYLPSAAFEMRDVNLAIQLKDRHLLDQIIQAHPDQKEKIFRRLEDVFNQTPSEPWIIDGLLRTIPAGEEDYFLFAVYFANTDLLGEEALQIYREQKELLLDHFSRTFFSDPDSHAGTRGIDLAFFFKTLQTSSQNLQLPHFFLEKELLEEVYRAFPLSVESDQFSEDIYEFLQQGKVQTFGAGYENGHENNHAVLFVMREDRVFLIDTDPVEDPTLYAFRLKDRTKAHSFIEKAVAFENIKGVKKFFAMLNEFLTPEEDPTLLQCLETLSPKRQKFSNCVTKSALHGIPLTLFLHRIENAPQIAWTKIAARAKADGKMVIHSLRLFWIEHLLKVGFKFSDSMKAVIDRKMTKSGETLEGFYPNFPILENMRENFPQAHAFLEAARESLSMSAASARVEESQ